jgi:hypothetical protein
MYYGIYWIFEKECYFFRYDYAAYDYQYDANSAAAYQSYAGYESSAAYAQPGTYEGYATSAAYPTGDKKTLINKIEFQ